MVSLIWAILPVQTMQFLIKRREHKSICAFFHGESITKILVNTCKILSSDELIGIFSVNVSDQINGGCHAQFAADAFGIEL